MLIPWVVISSRWVPPLVLVISTTIFNPRKSLSPKTCSPQSRLFVYHQRWTILVKDNSPFKTKVLYTFSYYTNTQALGKFNSKFIKSKVQPRILTSPKCLHFPIFITSSLSLHRYTPFDYLRTFRHYISIGWGHTAKTNKF